MLEITPLTHDEPIRAEVVLDLEDRLGRLVADTRQQRSHQARNCPRCRVQDHASSRFRDPLFPCVSNLARGNGAAGFGPPTVTTIPLHASVEIPYKIDVWPESEGPS